MADIKHVIFKFRRGNSTMWGDANYVLREGEPGFDLISGRFKIGDGIRSWNELDYFVPETEIAAMIQAAIEAGGGGDGEGLEELIEELADDGHPDGIVDGISFELLYENRKV